MSQSASLQNYKITYKYVYKKLLSDWLFNIYVQLHVLTGVDVNSGPQKDPVTLFMEKTPVLLLQQS